MNIIKMRAGLLEKFKSGKITSDEYFKVLDIIETMYKLSQFTKPHKVDYNGNRKFH